MARKPDFARRIARLTPLAAVAVALAAPSAASAQFSPVPTDDGILAYSEGTTVKTMWPNGTYMRTEQATGVVGGFDGNGDAFSVAAGPMTIDRFAVGPGTFKPGISNPAAMGVMQGSAFSTDGSAIAYTNGGKLYQSNLGFGPIADVGSPRIGWSYEAQPEGRLVYDSADGLIRVRDWNGSDSGLVHDPAAQNPTISPDGIWVAWEKETTPGDRDIYLLDTRGDNSPFKFKGQTTSDDYLPTFSPDSQRIAFVTKNSGGNRAILEYPIASGQSGVISYAVQADVTGMAWQPSVTPVAGAITLTGADAPKTGTAVGFTTEPDTVTLPADIKYTWQRCPADKDPGEIYGGACEWIGHDGATYTPTAADLGKRLRVINDVWAPAGGDMKVSGLSGVVVADDTTKPHSPIFDEVPPVAVDTPYPTFAFTGSEAGDKFACRVREDLPSRVDIGWVDCDSPYTTNELADGKYVISIRQIDAAGNEGELLTHRFEVDTQHPAMPTLTKAPPMFGTSSTATIEFTGTGETGARFECRVDDLLKRESGTRPEWEACKSPVTLTDLAVGPHRLEVRELDLAGNPSPAASTTWYVEQAPAAPVVTTRPEAQTTATDAVIEFTGEGFLECSVDGGKFAECESPLKLSGLAVGEHVVRLRVVSKHHIASEPAVVAWTVVAPKVELPAPVVQTPVVEPPKVVEDTKPAAPRARLVPKAPALTATIGGTRSGAQVGANGGTSAAATIEVAKESVGVGCSITGTVLKSCKVDLYADVATGTTARAAAAKQVLVGTGIYEAKAGSSKMDVRIELNATGKQMLRANPGGLKVQVRILGKPVSGAPLKATGVAKLVTDRASLTVGGFDVRSSVLTPAAKAQLRRLAKFGKAHSVRCVGHTDGSSQDDDYLQSLGARRAKAVCSYLAKHGLKASTTRTASKADTAPAASNATKAGRAKNRRVQVSIVR